MAETKQQKPMTEIEKKFAKAFPGAKMHKIRLDRHLGGDKKSVYVGVNGHGFQVPTGKELEVPFPIYDRLKKMEIQMDVLENIREEIPNDL